MARTRFRAIGKAFLWIAVVYAVLWFGGDLSYRLTHDCVRKRVEAYPEGGTVTFCEQFGDNGRRWTPLGPIRELVGK